MTSLCLPVDEGLISIYLQRAYATLLQHPFLNNIEKVRVCREFFFLICCEYKVRRLNNILIIGNPRDINIRQCIHNQTNLIYCVNSHYGIGLIMRCYLFLSACKMARVWAKFVIP